MLEFKGCGRRLGNRPKYQRHEMRLLDPDLQRVKMRPNQWVPQYYGQKVFDSDIELFLKAWIGKNIDEAFSSFCKRCRESCKNRFFKVANLGKTEASGYWVDDSKIIRYKTLIYQQNPVAKKEWIEHNLKEIKKAKVQWRDNGPIPIGYYYIKEKEELQQVWIIRWGRYNNQERVYYYKRNRHYKPNTLKKEFKPVHPWGLRNFYYQSEDLIQLKNRFHWTYDNKGYSKDQLERKFEALLNREFVDNPNVDNDIETSNQFYFCIKNEYKV